jgi:probable rRNA maturation factor
LLKNLYVTSTTKNINKLQIHHLISLLRKDLEFNLNSLFVNFISSGEIHKINKQYLNHDCSTDIITFNYSGDHDQFDGEIFISLEDARNFAKKYKVTLNKEVIRLIIHGILHLKGYDDISKSDRTKMKRIENNLTNKYNFALLR